MVRRIRTGCSVPLLYVPRTTGTFPVPRGDESDTHAPTPITITRVTVRRDGAAKLRNCLPHCVSHSVERARDIVIAVRCRHEARLEWRRRQIDAFLERRVKEFPKERHIGTLGHCEITNRFTAEEKTPHRSRAVRRQRNAELA